jgi:hypothetical protein
MAEKRKRPTRAELDERLRSALNGIPAALEAVATHDVASAAATPTEPRHWSRTVSGRIEGSDSSIAS